MKIVIVQPSMNYLGGAQLLALNLAKELSKKHKVTIITNMFNKSLFNKEKLKIIETGVNKRLFNIGKFFFPEMELSFLLSLNKVNKYLKKLKPDVVISKNFPSNWVKHKNVFWYCEEPPFALYEKIINKIEFSKNKKGFYPSYIIRRLLINIFKIIDKKRVCGVKKIFTNGKRSSFLVKKIYSRNSEIIHPGIPLEKPKIPKEISSRTKKLFKKSINLLVISRFFKTKNVGLAIKAFNELKADNKRLIIVGDGPEKESLRKIATDKIVFTGKISELKKCSLIKNCDLMLYPCLYEPFGLVPLEAMLYKKPVIAVNQWGPTETIIDGKTGLLTKNNADDFKKAIKRLVKNSDLRRKMGNEGYKRLKKDFSIKKMADDLIMQIKKNIK